MQRPKGDQVINIDGEFHLRCAMHSRKQKRDVYFPEENFSNCVANLYRRRRHSNCKPCHNEYLSNVRSRNLQRHRVKVEREGRKGGPVVIWSEDLENFIRGNDL